MAAVGMGEKEEGLVAAEAGCGLGHPVLRLCACAARLRVCCLVCAASCPDVDPLGTEGWGDNRKRRELLGRSSVGRDADADAVSTGGCGGGSGPTHSVSSRVQLQHTAVFAS